MGPSTESVGIRFSTFRFCFPGSHSLENPSTKGCCKNPNFRNTRFFLSFEPQMTVFVKETNGEDAAFPKLDFRTTKIHNSENVRFWTFRIIITDCVKNLIGK